MEDGFAAVRREIAQLRDETRSGAASMKAEVYHHRRPATAPNVIDVSSSDAVSGGGVRGRHSS